MPLLISSGSTLASHRMIQMLLEPICDFQNASIYSTLPVDNPPGVPNIRCVSVNFPSEVHPCSCHSALILQHGFGDVSLPRYDSCHTLTQGPTDACSVVTASSAAILPPSACSDCHASSACCSLFGPPCIITCLERCVFCLVYFSVAGTTSSRAGCVVP